MRLALGCALLASALLGLSSCKKAESPDKVQAGVAKTQSDAVVENAKADKKQRQVEVEAAKERAEAQAKAVDKSVSGLVDSAVTQAEGETRVALAKCRACDRVVSLASPESDGVSSWIGHVRLSTSPH